MTKVGIFMADGCEEIEALTVVDMCRRAGIDIQMISIMDKMQVVGSHKIAFEADAMYDDVHYEELDGVVLPGGMPGTLNLGAHAGVNAVIKEFDKAGKLVAAICAAPSVLGEAGLLEGRAATSYPGFEEKLKGAELKENPVAVSEHIITSRGMGTAIDFSLAIIAHFLGQEKAEELAKQIIYK